MFNSLSDIKKIIHEFQRNSHRYPNVLFVSRKQKHNLFRLLDDKLSSMFECGPYIIDGPQSYTVPASFEDSKEITIFGLKVKWTENIDGVDYFPELDEKVDIRKYSVKTKASNTQEKKRKIVL